jgi:hypothetical protein
VPEVALSLAPPAGLRKDAPARTPGADEGVRPVPAAASPRTPSVVLLAVVSAVSVLCAAVALTARQSSPPTIAEFAPQAVEQIKQTLEEQAADAPPPGEVGPDGLPTGSTPPPTVDTDGDGVPDATATPSPPPVTEVPRVRQCVGTPPRQTEDPQSPPCNPYFDPEQDNGGATALGVTGDTITVAMPVQFFENTEIPPILVDFFNKRYEFYGRKLAIKLYNPTGCANGVPNPREMQADAVKVAKELEAFASLAYCNAQQADQYYYDALADKDVISVPEGNLTSGTEAAYARRAPFQWNVLPGTDVQLASTAQFVCTTLAGRPPVYGGPGVSGRTTPRQFGLIYTQAADGTTPDVSPLRDGLRACGVSLTERRENAGSDASAGSNAILEMSRAGVTSILCVCGLADTRNAYMTAATAQGYQPEWIVGTYGGNDLDNSFNGGNAPPDQAAHVFGLTFRTKQLPKQDMPWYWAVREASPSSDPQGGTYYAAQSRYLQLLLLASGIQRAGPILTPESFETALHNTRFPNPGAGGPPYYQSRVGFEGRRHVMTDDAAMFWYDQAGPGTIDPAVPGRKCYVDRGRRTGLGQWQRGDPAFFSGPCL